MIGLMGIKTKIIFLHDLLLLLHDPLDLPNVALVISIGLHDRSGVLDGEDDPLKDSYKFCKVLVELVLEYRLWLFLVH